MKKDRLAILLAISMLATSMPFAGEITYAEEAVVAADVSGDEDLLSGNETDSPESGTDQSESEAGESEEAPETSEEDSKDPEEAPDEDPDKPEDSEKAPDEDQENPENASETPDEGENAPEDETEEVQISENEADPSGDEADGVEEIVVGVQARAIPSGTEADVYNNDGSNNSGGVQLGRFKINDDNKTATFMNGYGSPTVHVPTYILVTGLDGEQAIEFEKDISTIEEDDEILDRIYTVTDIDPECFKYGNATSIQRIELPNTITSKITYEFFEMCRQLASIHIYFWGDTGNRVLKYGRYYDGGQEVYGNRKEFATGVLIDRDFDTSGNIVKQTVVCCPRNTALTSFRFTDEKSSSNRTIVIGPHAFEGCTGLRSITSGNVDTNNDRVTEIGESAFEGCSNLTAAYVFDTTLMSIGDYAFKDCRALTNVVFATGHQGETKFSLGKKVFENTKIASLDLPFYVTDLTAESFYGMNDLSEIRVDENNTTYVALENVLYRKDENKDDKRGDHLILCPSSREMDGGEFKIPYGTETFDEYAFYNCKYMTRLIFPSNVKSLEENVVTNCKYLNTVYVYSGFYQQKTSPLDGQEYYKDLFKDCGYSKQTVTIYTGRDTPAWSFAIAYDHGKKALYDPDDFEVTDEGGSLTVTKYDYSSEFRDTVIPAWLKDSSGVYKPVTKIGSGVLAKPGMTSVMFLANMKDVDAEAFRIIDPNYMDDVTKDICADSLKNIYIEDGNPWLRSENGVLYKIRDGMISGLIYYPVGRIDEEFYVPEELEYIPMSVFRGASNLKKIFIYDTIQGIGSEHYGAGMESAAFAGCNNLVAIEILESDDTERVKFYKSDEGVLYGAQSDSGGGGNRYAMLIYYPKGERRPADVTYSAMSYQVASGCTVIRDMKNCIYLQRIIIPSSVTDIEDKAFEGSTALRTVEFRGTGIKNIGDEAFAFTNIQALTLPGSIETIGRQAFYRCLNLRSVQITGNELKTIGSDAFNGDRNIKTISIVSEGKDPSGDAFIDERAFANLTSLESLEIKNLKTVRIGAYAFAYDRALVSAAFDRSNVGTIGQDAFRSCAALKEISFVDSNSLSVVSPEAFKGCSALENVVLPISLTQIDKSAFEDCVVLGELNFEDLRNLMFIGESAFRNTGFSMIRLPENLSTLGGSAFGDCAMLTAVFVPDALQIELTDKNPFDGADELFTLYGSANTLMQAYAKSHSIRYVVGEVPDIRINLNETEISLYDVGVTSYQLLATTQPENEEIIWRCSNPEVVNVDPKSGFVRALAAGTSKVYAVCAASGSRAVCNVRVIKTEVVIAEDSVIMNLKDKMEIHAVSVPLRQISYETSNKKIAAINKKGVVTAKKVGPAVITATAGEGETFRSDTVNITVVKPTISLDKKRITLNEKGEGALLSEELLVSHFGAYEEVKWVSSNPRIATVEGDNESAIVTAQRSGSVKITAICNGKKATCRVKVKPVYTRLNKTVAKLYVGGSKIETLKLKAKVSGISKEVEWTSDRPEIAYVDEKGVVTAQSRGTAVITASANGIGAQCTVNVIESTVTILDKEGATLVPPIIVMNSAGNNKEKLNAIVEGRSKKVKWSSLAKDVVQVNSKGQLTGRNAGETEVVAMANGVESYCTVKVLDTRTELNIDELMLSVSGENSSKLGTLRVEIEGADLRKTVKWESSNSEVAAITMAETVAKPSQTLSEFGGIAWANITPVKPGKAVIYVTANGVTAKCKVEVVE